MNSPTAAALVIGNELLTGKIREANVSELAKLLFDLGISLRRVVVCGDDVETIVGDLNSLRADHDHVFTSGGIGPTHDDVTMAAVAQAFDRPLVRSAVLEAMLREFFGERCTDGHLRMADIPRGADLLRSPKVRWPVIRVVNVHVLPGLPEVFLRKMPILREHLHGSLPFLSRAVSTLCDEGEVAGLLARLAEKFPEVTIGSYPRWEDGSPRLTVTFDAQSPEAIAAAAEALIDNLPAEQLASPEDSDTEEEGDS